MPLRASAVLLALFVIAASAFGMGLYALTEGHDLLSLLLCAIGALSLRALHQSARLAESAR